MPEVSVVILAHNAGVTIGAALASVSAQTFHDYELIVVDAGSTDDTADRIAASGSSVRYFHQHDAGTASAWNTGVRLAQGRIVMLLEATHLWMPRKLERQLRYFEAYPQTGFLHGDAIATMSPSVALRDLADAAPIEPTEPPMLCGRLSSLPRSILASTVAIRTSALDKVGYFDVALDPSRAQQDLWTRLAARFPVGHLPVPVTVVGTNRRADKVPLPAIRRSTSLLHDTRFRRGRTAVASAVHRIDDFLAQGSGRPLRVLFEAASPMSLAVFSPVFQQLRRDPRLEFWFTSYDRSWDASAAFASAGITERVVSSSSIRWAKFDGYVNTDFWDMTWLPRRTRRMHFFHGVAGKYGLDAPVKIAPIVATFDRLMFPNRDRLQRYAEAGIIDAESPEAALIGYPKVDCLVDGTLDRNATLARLGLDATRPTVLYAPTWSPYSSLGSVGHDVIAALGKLGVNVVVKLHDRSYDAAQRASGGIDWRRDLLAQCVRYGARLVQDADVSPWLHAADLLVTDHSSVGFEFMLLDRPLVVLDIPELIARARVNLDKVSMLRRASFVVHPGEAIGPIARQALDNPLVHQHERRRVAEALFYCPGTATARAVQCFYDLLGLTVPETAGQTSPARTTDRFVLNPARPPINQDHGTTPTIRVPSIRVQGSL